MKSKQAWMKSYYKNKMLAYCPASPLTGYYVHSLYNLNSNSVKHAHLSINTTLAFTVTLTFVWGHDTYCVTIHSLLYGTEGCGFEFR